MGWNSWNKYACDINETIVKATADALVSTGLADLGYIYVNIDDCWQASRDENGYIVPDKTTFPSGMKSLADYVHSKNLKFGVYSSAGTLTCQKRPGSLFYETLDAQKYAEWGVDYLKYDNCYNENLNDYHGTLLRYGAMGDALNETGRHILYSLCQWGDNSIWNFGDSLGHSWRINGDIYDSFASITSIIDKMAGISRFSKPGGFNDPDMLEVGNGGMTIDEYSLHFAAWAAMKAPLILGNDLNNMPAEVFNILSNEEVIAINQDRLGVSAHRYSFDANIDVWIGPLFNGDRVLLVMNRRPTSAKVLINFSWFIEPSSTEEIHFALRDVLKRKPMGIMKSSQTLKQSINSHGAAMFRLSAVKGSFSDFDLDHGLE